MIGRVHQPCPSYSQACAHAPVGTGPLSFAAHAKPMSDFDAGMSRSQACVCSRSESVKTLPPVWSTSFSTTSSLPAEGPVCAIALAPSRKAAAPPAIRVLGQLVNPFAANDFRGSFGVAHVKRRITEPLTPEDRESGTLAAPLGPLQHEGAIDFAAGLTDPRDAEINHPQPTARV